MKLISIFFVCLAGFSNGNEIGFSLERLLARNDEKCGKPGDNTPTTCVSKTQFVYNFQDIDTAVPVSCPAGTVCADVEGACAAGVKPACTNDAYVGPQCSKCNTDTNLACISPTAFTACSGGFPVVALASECTVPLQYCKIVSTPYSVCQASAAEADCKAPIVPPTPSVPPKPPTTAGCTTTGIFPVLTDSTCKAYYSCTTLSAGGYQKTDYNCPGTYVFNRNTKRCESANAYRCPP